MKIKNLIALFLGLFLFPGCRDRTHTPKETHQGEPIINKNTSKNTLLVGATLNYSELDTKKETLFLKDFIYLTPANAAKQSIVHPRPNIWEWNPIEDFISFSKQHELVVRLHAPISPQASTWAKEDHRTATELSTNMVEFTTAFTRRFNNEPTVKWMDVVNETILANGEWFGPKPGTDKWENPWLNIGMDNNGYPIYIVTAFKIATKYAPNIKLIYNQNAGMETVMWDKVKNTVLYLRSQGCRVDGIGWQAHLLLGAKRKDFVENIDETLKKMANLIDWAHANELGFHVTELDYLIRTKDLDNLEQERIVQRDVYQKIVKVLQEKSKQGEVTLNLWNLGVRTKKETGKFQSIYDESLDPSPAYHVIRSVIEKNKVQIESYGKSF